MPEICQDADLAGWLACWMAGMLAWLAGLPVGCLACWLGWLSALMPSCPDKTKTQTARTVFLQPNKKSLEIVILVQWPWIVHENSGNLNSGAMTSHTFRFPGLCSP